MESTGKIASIGRVTRSREEARTSYDRISGWYDVLEGRWERKPVALGLRKLAAKPGETVLEIGFGTGHGLVSIARSVGRSGRVFGADLSPRMLALARHRVMKEGFPERVMLMEADAVAGIPLPDRRIDAVFMSFVLELFDTPEIPVVLGECARLLRTGGRICVVSLSKKGGSAAMRSTYERAHEMFPRLIDCRPIFASRDLEEAGFRVTDMTTVSLMGLPVEIAIGRAEA